MHFSHAPYGPGCNVQTVAAGVFPSMLSVKLPALLLADVMLSRFPAVWMVHLPLNLFGLLRRAVSCCVMKA